MKFHFALVDTVAQGLTEIFTGSRYADRVVEQLLRSNPNMGARDRAFVAETTYDIVRWWRLLQEVSGHENSTERRAVLDVISAYFFIFHGERPQWKENYGVNFESISEKFEAAKSQRALRESIPDWLDELCYRELGEKWEAILPSLNRTAEVILRVNTLRSDKATVQQALKQEGTATLEVEGAPDALVLEKRQNVFRTEAFKNGLFEVQDAGSQAIAPFLEVKPGMRVIDSCAGAGGKTLHLAALMQNKGRIVALDVEPRKLEELRRRARRAGVAIIETKAIESAKTIKRLQGSADRLLLDVPCSGLGTLRRNPDAKWKLDAEFIERVKKIQAEILVSHSRMLKPGGRMVYATCSILPSENEQQVQAFLASHPGFALIREQKISPESPFHDGFYMALIEKQAE